MLRYIVNIDISAWYR